MAINHPKTGPNYVPAYQVSGIPFVTASAANEVQCVSLSAAEVRDPTVVNFPYVTKFITIRNTGNNELRVGFSERGVFAPGERLPTSAGGDSGAAKGTTTLDTANYFLIPTGSGGSDSNGNAQSTQTFDIRCKKIVFLSNNAHANPKDTALSSSFTLLAGLTNIQASQFPILTGSSGFEGVG